MPRFVILLLLSVSVDGVASSADSFASVLRDSTHVGLTVNEHLSSVDIHVYSAEQYRANAAALKQYDRELEEYKQRLASWEQERRAAQERRASTDELNAITLKRGEIRKPYSEFENKIRLHRVVAAGSDYFKLDPLDSSEKTVLVPFAKVTFVYLKDDDTNVPGDSDGEPSNATERRSRAN